MTHYQTHTVNPVSGGCTILHYIVVDVACQTKKTAQDGHVNPDVHVVPGVVHLLAGNWMDRGWWHQEVYQKGVGVPEQEVRSVLRDGDRMRLVLLFATD